MERSDTMARIVSSQRSSGSRHQERMVEATRKTAKRPAKGAGFSQPKLEREVRQVCDT